jgi:single-stranded-DNA-specific exonuclease
MMKGIDTKEDLEIDAWLTMPEITLDLARELEGLAPYGPGNERLTLATHGLKIQTAATIGRNQEHLKLKVTDDSGDSQTLLWWNGAEQKDSLPESSFDLAYCLRASDWRGSPQVQMEFVDFHPLDTEKIEIKRRQLEILDYRNVKEPFQILETLQRRPSIMLWAEGQGKKAAGGRGLNELKPAEELILWSIPPSPDELHAALSKVNPRKLYLFAVTEPIESTEAFLGRLAGLLKYAINQHGGIVPYSALETGTAQRPVTVRKGVEWLVAQGEIEIKMKEENHLVVYIGDSQKDPAGAVHLWGKIKSLLAETAAYREYFKRADKDILFD